MPALAGSSGLPEGGPDGRGARLRVAVVGLGFGERVLVPAFRADSRCEVVGMCARHEERARAAAGRLGIARAFRSWREAVDAPDVDALAIAVPPSAQAEIAMAALERRRHLLCEKPLAMSAHDAAAMRDAAAAAGVAHMVDFEFPEIPAWQRAREIVASGELGRLRQVEVAWHRETYAIKTGEIGWKSRPDQGGGALQTFVSHSFYYLEWMLGPIGEVWASPISDASDTSTLLGLRLADGTPIHLSVCTAAFLGSGHAVTVYGDAGTLVLANRTDDLVAGFELMLGTRATDRLTPVPVEVLPGQESDGRVAAVASLVRRFVTWAVDGRPSRPDFSDGLRVQALIDAASRARSSAGRVRL